MSPLATSDGAGTIPAERFTGSLSGSEGEGGAVLFGTCWFPPKVYEITVVSRLASPFSTDVVETCHPLLSCTAANPVNPGLESWNHLPATKPQSNPEGRHLLLLAGTWFNTTTRRRIPAAADAESSRSEQLIRPQRVRPTEAVRSFRPLAVV